MPTVTRSGGTLFAASSRPSDTTAAPTAAEARRKRVREMIDEDPAAVGALIETLSRDIMLHMKYKVASAAVAAAVRSPASDAEASEESYVGESSVLSDAELRSFYQYVHSSGRCRRDCPELYPHLVRRAAALRHEDDDEDADPPQEGAATAP